MISSTPLNCRGSVITTRSNRLNLHINNNIKWYKITNEVRRAEFFLFCFVLFLSMISYSSWLVSSVCRALHRYRKVHWFKSRRGLNFFRPNFHYLVFITSRIAFTFACKPVDTKRTQKIIIILPTSFCVSQTINFRVWQMLSQRKYKTFCKLSLCHCFTDCSHRFFFLTSLTNSLARHICWS